QHNRTDEKISQKVAKHAKFRPTCPSFAFLRRPFAFFATFCEISETSAFLRVLCG
ncbi:MAG: hypothetical protein ACI9X0_000242, partial [Kiritimatiellia bacterium]